MATITSAGIGSGLDVEGLVTKLMSLERQPVQQLKQRTDGLKTQVSAIGKLQSSLSGLRDSVTRLSRVDGFGAASATSSDATTVTASASNGAALGSYAIKVANLAQAQSTASKAFAANSSTGTGTITIQLGKYSDDLSQFDADPKRTSLIIPVAAGEDDLSKIRDKINAMKAGIVANVVTDVNGSRLVMRAVESGTANAFRVTVADDDGTDTDGDGLSAFAIDRTSTSEVNLDTLKQEAKNSLLTIDGVSIESATNRIEDAIQGVTVNLLRPTALDASTTLTIGQDQAATKKLVTDFVSSYNDTIKQLRELTRNDPDGTTGPLRGDQTLASIQNQLRQLASGSSTLGGSFTRLASIGLDPSTDGSLKINDVKLEAALAKPDDIKGLLGGIDTSDASNNGIATRLRELTDQLLSSDGRIESRKKGLATRIESNGDREEALNRRLELVEKRLRAQYTALDGTQSRASGLSSYLQQQLSRL
jgi:flagellar hook-associated protein 2